jgi:diacylglycerol kinase
MSLPDGATGLDGQAERRYAHDRGGHPVIMLILQSSPRPSDREEAALRSRPRLLWRDRLRPAFRGIKLGVRGHSRFFVHFFCTALVIAAAIVLRCDLIDWCLLLGCVGLMFVSELLNSALTALFRGLDEESQHRAAPCLDIAFGAVLLAGLTVSLIGSLIFLSRLIEMCAPLFPSRQ